LILDLAIRGGTVLAGPECTPLRADVGVADGAIVEIGNSVGRSRATLDATGRFISPGFIDIHTHSDFTLPVRPAAEAKLRQGVTTDVTGNCGFSPFPFPNEPVGRQHGGFFEPELGRRWPTFAAYASDLEGNGMGINLAPLVGLGAVRTAIMGEQQKAPSERELEAMRSLLGDTLEQGAFGASSGLVYAPGSYADVEELSALASVVARYDGIYATHVRNETDELESAIAEALTTGASSGCSVQISHLKAMGVRNWGAIESRLAQIENSNSDGDGAWVDVYPYTAGSTSLMTLLPESDLSGGEAGLRRRLEDASERRRIVDAVAVNPMAELENVVFAHLPSRPTLAGKSLVVAAEEEGMSPADLVVSAVQADGREAVMIVHGMSEDDVRSVLRHPRSIVGSDGWVMSAAAVPYTHPRSFAYSARLLAHYVRDEAVLTLGSAIQKLAVLPGRRIGLADRGVLAPQMVADIAVFDLDRLQEVANFTYPCAYPTGFDHVVVAGEVALEAGELTGRTAGRILRRASS
jgi:N-acyl-D-amino-acid deacylase